MEEPTFVQITHADVAIHRATAHGVPGEIAVLQLYLSGALPDGTDTELPPLVLTVQGAAQLSHGLRTKLESIGAWPQDPTKRH